jgi:hypothetical protein
VLGRGHRRGERAGQIEAHGFPPGSSVGNVALIARRAASLAWAARLTARSIYRPTARSNWALFIFERPLMFFAFASL